MATITASLERSLQNCSLNQTTRSRRGNGGGSGGLGRSSSSDSPENYHYNINQSRNNSRRPINDDVVAQSNVASSSDDNSTFVELNPHVSLPYHWEQCLDLKVLFHSIFVDLRMIGLFFVLFFIYLCFLLI